MTYVTGMQTNVLARHWQTLAMTFSLSAQDPDRSLLSPGTMTWSLDFGDGSAVQRGTGNPPASVPHTYAAAGAYPARLVVGDGEGAIGRAMHTVTPG